MLVQPSWVLVQEQEPLHIHSLQLEHRSRKWVQRSKSAGQVVPLRIRRRAHHHIRMPVQPSWAPVQEPEPLHIRSLQLEHRIRRSVLVDGITTCMRDRHHNWCFRSRK